MNTNCKHYSNCLDCKFLAGEFYLPCEKPYHIIDKLAEEHETLSKITAHLANGEDDQARTELSEMVWRLAGVADSLQNQEEN